MEVVFFVLLLFYSFSSYIFGVTVSIYSKNANKDGPKNVITLRLLSLY